MKKVFLFGIAALLALAVFSCGDVIPQAENRANVVGYTADGRAIVELELGVGISNARALHGTLAKAGADFYEVIFTDNGNTTPGSLRAPSVSRISWREGSVARLRVVTGVTYDNTATDDHGRAYVFAGRYSDKTLLGVGTLSLTWKDTVSSAAKLIDIDVTGVTFTLEPLETKISTDAGPTGTSSFKTTPPADVPPITINEVDVPVYLIDDVTPTIATFTIRPLSAGLASVIMAAASVGPTFVQSLPFIAEGDMKPVELDSVTITDGVTVDTAVAFPIEITMTPKIVGPATKSDPGLAKIFFQIPVYLYDNTTTPLNGTKDPVIWYFRGGLNNSLVDMGYDEMSLGGAILIGVGDVLAGGKGSKEIFVTWP